MQTLRSLSRLVLSGILLVSTAIMRVDAAGLPESLNVKGGFIVHLGCGDGQRTLTLRSKDSYQVHGLDTDSKNVAQARAKVKAAGVYGPVSIDRLAGNKLPYIDGMVNLVVVEKLGEVPMTEVMRVLAPKGVAHVNHGG